MAVGVVTAWVAAKVALGEPAIGKVIEFHHTGSSSRNASIAGEVNVVMRDGVTFRDEVDDALGSQDWVVCGDVELRCTHFYDHWSCSANSGLSQFLFPLCFLGVGAGMMWWSARKICRH